MCDKLMYILDDDTQNYLFCGLQLVVETFTTNLMNKPIKIHKKSSKLLFQRIRKRLGIINSPLSPLSELKKNKNCLTI